MTNPEKIKSMPKKDKRASHEKGMSKLDIHYINYLKVAKHEYFMVDSRSANEVAGLLIGTEVRKIREPECRPSTYWRGDYYSVLVECPNGETRKVGCDALVSRKTDKYFMRQVNLYQ